MRRRFVTMLVAGAMAISAVGAAPVGAQDDASVLRVARLADHFNFFHPVQFQTGNQFQWYDAIFDTLVDVAADSKTVVGGLADTWEVSDDATEFTFNLNPDATWHDGEPVTADDVLFTVNWYANNSTLTESGALAPVYKGFTPMWGGIAGVADAAGSLGEDGKTVTPGTGAVSGIEKIDDHTVKITLSAPNAEFLVRLADAANIILPEHSLKDATANDIETADFTKGTPGVTIGSGPYKLAAFTPDQSVELEANPDYFRGAPLIDRIVFKLFADPALAIAQLESGELDLAFRVPPAEFDRLSGIPTLNVISAPNPGISRIVFATDKAPWSSVDVRQAFAHAINKQAIVDQYFKGRGHVLYNHPGFTVYDDINKYEFDPAKAGELLASGGYAGETFKLLYDGTFPDMGAIMPLIQSDLQNAGITVELVPTEGAQAFVEMQKDRTKWDGYMALGGSEGLSPDRSQDDYYEDPNAPGTSAYTNPRIYELWDAGVATADEAQRDVAYHELAVVFNTDLAMLHLYSWDLIMAATKSLGGTFDIHLNERETFKDVETWTLEPAS